MNASALAEAVLFLAAAVIVVPLSRRLGLGSVLGFLIAGIAIGPWGLAQVHNIEDMLHLSELGVVLLLFIIGLELQPSRLWALRRPVFLLGGAQVLVTGLLLALAALAFGLPATPAIVVGFVLSFSSTAFVLQFLAERRQLMTQYGRTSFAILLFQDLAAIPLLALIPLLAGSGDISGEDGLLGAIKAAGVIAAVIVGGRLLLRPLLRFAASSVSQDIFIATSLLIVMGTALLLQYAGLSMALGAFLAGVLLADSEYRHELEADIEPFKALLLGLFFMSVGMSVDLGLILRQPWLIVGLTGALISIKAGVLWVLARVDGQDRSSATHLALTVSQGGEFAFVLFGVAAGHGLLDKPVADALIVVVSLSLALTPVLVFLSERVFKWGVAATGAREFDRIEPREHRVIIAGFGRVGQIVARTLRMRRIPFTALEASFEQVDFVRRFGNKIHFGDASRLDLLKAAGADKAEVFVLAIDDIAASLKTAEMLVRHFPHLKIYARARNRHHLYRLMDLGIKHIFRETFASSLEMAEHVLEGLEVPAQTARDTVARFRRYDEELVERQHKIHHDEAQLIATSKQAAEELERLFEQDTVQAEAAPQSAKSSV